MTTLKATQTHCTLCSLGCTLGFETTPLGKVFPAYPGHITDNRHGICGRGHLNYELVDHALRLEHPLVRQNGRLEPVPLAWITEAVGPRLATEPTLVLADGSLCAEDLLAAATFARLLGNGAVFSIYMDPADAGMLTGLAASGVPILTPEQLAECDAVLSIGDAFGTHPIISRAVHATTRRNPRRLFAVIDSVPSRTTKFSNAFLQVRPATTSLVLKFLAGESVTAANVAGKAEVTESELLSLDAKLKTARKLGVLVACDFGRDQDPEAVGLLAGRIAQKASGGVLPLPILGNAWAALGIHKTFEAVPIGEALSRLTRGKFRNVLLLGVNPSVETPLPGLADALARTNTLIVGTSLRPTSRSLGTHFLPLATAVEASSTVVNGSTEVVELASVTAPAGGALPVRDILHLFAARVGQASALSTTLKSEWLKPIAGSPDDCLKTDVLPVEPRTGELVAVSESGSVHLGSGVWSSRMSWPNVFEKTPAVRMAPEDAANRGLENARPVTVTSSNGSATMTLKVDVLMKPGRVALMATTPAVRTLFLWKQSHDGGIHSGPVAVRVSAS